MFFRIATSNSLAVESTLGFATVFEMLGQINSWPNTPNRFAYSKREAQFAT